MSHNPVFQFDNTYVNSLDRFFVRTDPTPVSEPKLIALNQALAEQLGLDASVLESPA